MTLENHGKVMLYVPMHTSILIFLRGVEMKINTIEDIRTEIQNSGLNEHFEHLDRDEFVQFCWDNMDGRYLELDDLFRDFLESKGEHSGEWTA